MIDNLICKIIFRLLHILYIKHNQPIFYIKGTENDYPKYLLYTEDNNVWYRMDNF